MEGPAGTGSCIRMWVRARENSRHQGQLNRTLGYKMGRLGGGELVRPERLSFLEIGLFLLASPRCTAPHIPKCLSPLAPSLLHGLPQGETSLQLLLTRVPEHRSTERLGVWDNTLWFTNLVRRPNKAWTPAQSSAPWDISCATRDSSTLGTLSWLRIQPRLQPPTHKWQVPGEGIPQRAQWS